MLSNPYSDVSASKEKSSVETKTHSERLKKERDQVGLKGPVFSFGFVF